MIFDKILYKREVLSKIDDKPLVSIQSLLFLNPSEFKNQKHKILNKKYRSVIIHNIYNKSDVHLIQQIGLLWWISIKNDNILFGICFRNFGTNYTTTQRLSLLMVRILISMAASAIFFGVSRDSIVGDWTLGM